MIQQVSSSLLFLSWISISLFSFLLVFPVQKTYASGAVMKRRQMKPKNARVHATAPGSLQVTAQEQQPEVAPEEVKDIVSLDDILDALKTSSQAWPLIIDMEAKEMVVERFIKRYRSEGVTINKTTSHYAHVIDALSQDSPEMLGQPFEQVFKIVAILEYDFNNGQDKDALALKILGSPEAVLKNKERLGIKE